MIKIFFLSAILYLVFRWDFEYERDHEQTGFLNHDWVRVIFLLALSMFSFRMYEGQFFYNALVHTGLFLLLVPDFILQKLFEKNISIAFIDKETPKKSSRSLLYLLFLSIIAPEFSLLFAVASWKNKQKIKNCSPFELSDTDQKLLSTLQIVWSLSLLFTTIISDITTYILSISLGVAASYYTKAGVDKLKHDWAFRNRLLYLKKAAEHQLCWNVIPDTVIRKIQYLSPLVFLLEISSCLYLSTLNDFFLIQIGLISLFGFHIAVLLSSGINFWKWKLSLISTIFLTLECTNQVLNETHFYIYAIVFLYFFFVSQRTPVLAWLDSPLSNFYKIEIRKTKDSPWKKLNPYHYAPYDVVFSQNRFNFLPFQKKNLVGCLGAIRDNEIYDDLLNLSVNCKDEKELKDSVNRLIEANGETSIDKNKSSKLIQWATLIKSNQSERSKADSLFSNIFSHIRNGYKETVEEKSIDEIDKLKITHTRIFWSEYLRKKVVLEEETILLDIVLDKNV